MSSLRMTLAAGAMLGLLSVASGGELASVEAGKKIKLKPKPAEVAAYEAYRKVVAQTAGMVGNRQAQQLAAKHGLQVLNVTWEDTGRFKGSSVGPNISDMTIQVQQRDPRSGKYSLTCMPVVRFPNFSDKTGDITPESFYMLVGNEKGKKLRRVSLKKFLGNIREYLAVPDSWKGKTKSLLAKRDSKVLVSAQACFLPIPKGGEAEFNPVLFNYQSYKGDPAVLTILCTRQGTSVTVIDNVRDRFSAGRTWGQRLFFNKKGLRCSLTGKRMSDFVKAGGSEKHPDPEKTVEAAEEEGLNMVLLIQVPLKQKKPMRFGGGAVADCAPPMELKRCAGKGSNVENAVIGHGKVEGPFTEIDNLEIERDPKFPVRVTVQFYKATSNGAVSSEDLADISKQIKRVYSQAEYVGSLVTGGDTGRITEYDGDKVQPPDWWGKFWTRYQKNTGRTRQEALEMLQKLYGPNWMPKTRGEMIRAIAAAEKKAGK
jgi:hypothetical protein